MTVLQNWPGRRAASVSTTLAGWLVGSSLILAAVACTSGEPHGGGTSSPSATLNTLNTTVGGTNCFEPVAVDEAPEYVGLSSKEAKSRATAKHDRLIVVEEDGQCTMRALSGYLGPALIVEVALVGGKVFEARSGHATSP